MDEFRDFPQIAATGSLDLPWIGGFGPRALLGLGHPGEAALNWALTALMEAP